MLPLNLGLCLSPGDTQAASVAAPVDTHTLETPVRRHFRGHQGDVSRLSAVLRRSIKVVARTRPGRGATKGLFGLSMRGRECLSRFARGGLDDPAGSRKW